MIPSDGFLSLLQVGMGCLWVSSFIIEFQCLYIQGNTKLFFLGEKPLAKICPSTIGGKMLSSETGSIFELLLQQLSEEFCVQSTIKYGYMS